MELCFEINADGGREKFRQRDQRWQLHRGKKAWRKALRRRKCCLEKKIPFDFKIGFYTTARENCSESTSSQFEQL